MYNVDPRVGVARPSKKVDCLADMILQQMAQSQILVIECDIRVVRAEPGRFFNVRNGLCRAAEIGQRRTELAKTGYIPIECDQRLQLDLRVAKSPLQSTQNSHHDVCRNVGRIYRENVEQ